MTQPPHRRPPGPPHLPGIPAALFRALIPGAERDEVVADLASEHADRAARRGPLAARTWLWMQLVGSLPTLFRRSWWRAWNGFEPRANWLQPGGSVFESSIIDLRYSVRRLASRPTYALLCVLTLALGAGGTAAIFSIVRTLLLTPLPVNQEEQLGVLWMDGSWTQEEFLHFRPAFPGFAAMAAYMPGDQTLARPNEPLRLVRGISATAEIFDVLGARPFIGRTFTAGEDLPGAAPAAVLSHGLWQELGGDPGLVGQSIELGGVSRIVVGVMPQGFWFPNPMVRAWTTVALDPQNRTGNWTLVGRAAPGANIGHMEAPLAALVAELGRRFTYPPEWDKTKGATVTPLRQFVVGDVRTSLLATLGAMALILLIAGVNVSALMLGQVSGRGTELAVRTALGAGRQRLVQQLVLESIVIGLLAGLAGAGIGAAGFRMLQQSLPLGALADAASLDWAVFAAAIGFALLTASIIAVVPALALWRGNLQGAIAASRTGGISGRGGALEGGLVIAQIAVALLLVAGAGLLIRSVQNLRGIDIGISPDTVAVVDATMPVQLTQEQRHRAVLDMVPVLQAIPGVTAAAAAERIPLLGSSDNWGMTIPARPEVGSVVTAMRIITDDYFRVMGITLRRGRGFQRTDTQSAERLVVINEALAAKYFGDLDPVGRTLRTFRQGGDERIIGVVGNVSENTLRETAVAARYMLYEHIPSILPAATFVLAAATAADVPRVVDAARGAVLREGRQLAIERTRAMSAVVDDAVGAPGRLATLLTLLAALALTLGSIGVYGTISHFVSRRSREYGIRIALGLPPARVVSQVIGRGLRLVGVGAVVGIAAAIALTRLMASLLYNVEATDPGTLVNAVLVLLLAGALAAFIPARRASRTDPVSVLRES